MNPIRVLVADDHAMVRTGFEMILNAQQDIAVVGAVGNGTAAVAESRRLRPDVVVVDVRMPELDGVAATRQICSTPEAPRVLVVTTFDVDQYVFDALRAGASGFLLKNAPPEQLVEAVRVLAAGDALLAPQVTRRVIEAFATAPRMREPEPGAVAELTPREREVLTLIAQGLSNAQIADQLFLGVGTVKTHVARILTKLGLTDRVQAVVFAYEMGLAVPGAGRRSDLI